MRKEGVKKKDALRQEAEERGIAGAESTRRKKNLRKKIVADAEQKAADVEAEHRSKVDEEDVRLICIRKFLKLGILLISLM